jgi:phosphosulfolactate synthase
MRDSCTKVNALRTIGIVAAPRFLSLPDRTDKPRRHGITHVLDKGLPLLATRDLLETAGPYLDVWKFGWGTAMLDPGLERKLELLGPHEVLACLGGTLLEVAFSQGAVDAYLDWAEQIGIPCVEVSNGAVAMTREEKDGLIRRTAERFVVLAEVGSKDPDQRPDPAAWAEEAARDLDAGATWVVTEGRESGTVGLYDEDGRVREDVLEAVVGAVDVACVVFEAPRRPQQAHLIRRFGANVNLANVAPADALGVEALRLGLRADTLDLTRTAAGIDGPADRSMPAGTT